MTKPYQLTSDILEKQFGPLEIEILFQNKLKRISCIKVISTGKSLEYAEVHFNKYGVDAYPDIHNKIIAGSLLGKTFRDFGVDITRKDMPRNTFTPDGKLTLMFPRDKQTIIKHAEILVGEHRTKYAETFEVYSPDIDF